MKELTAAMKLATLAFPNHHPAVLIHADLYNGKTIFNWLTARLTYRTQMVPIQVKQPGTTSSTVLLS